MANAIEIKNLVKKYDDVVAVNSLSLEIKDGELYSLLGVNGAGKTTTIKMLTGLIRPTDGDALLYGKSIVSSMPEIKKFINLSPQETAIAPNLTVYENIKFVADIYDVKDSAIIEDIINQFDLVEIRNKRAAKLSGGWQRRLSIAMALVSSPKIVFLDEPTLGLDVLARRELWRAIEKLKGKITIILTTHYMEEAEALSDRIAIMNKGKLITTGTVKELLDRTKKPNLEEAFVEIVDSEVSK